MGEEEKFDAIVVGAGPAGIACGYLLAKEGKSVLIIERGETAGSKNVTGGRLYTYALEMVEPGLTAKAALERKITREQITMLSDNRSMTIDFADFDFDGEVPQSYSVLRAVFDEWFASEAEAQGAMVAAGIRVDDVIEKDGKIVGIKAGEDEMYADVVVAADGVNSFMAQKAGMWKDITEHQVGVGAKEIIEFSSEAELSKAFGLSDGEGIARCLLGCTEGLFGGGFMYTNKTTVSLGLVTSPASLGKQPKRIHDMMQDLKMHPAIYPFIKNGTTVEYSAHLVPEAGWNGVPKTLYRDGMIVLGDAAGFVINTGYSIRGIDLAILSGVAAARAILEAKDSKSVGPMYMKELKNTKLIPSMKAVAGFPAVLENTTRMFTVYPKMANEVMHNLFTVDGSVPPKLGKMVFNTVTKHASIGQLLSDAWRGKSL